MPVIHFLGRIVPASAKHISLSYPTPTDKLQSKYVSPENDLEAALTFRIANSQVDVECELNRFDDSPDFLGILHKPVYDLTHALVSIVDFSTGYGLMLYFDYLIKPDGQRSPLLMQHPNLAALCTSFRPVSYTHLDVYKRQGKSARVASLRNGFLLRCAGSRRRAPGPVGHRVSPHPAGRGGHRRVVPGHRIAALPGGSRKRRRLPALRGRLPRIAPAALPAPRCWRCAVSVPPDILDCKTLWQVSLPRR